VVTKGVGTKGIGTATSNLLYKKSRRGGAYVFPGLIKGVKDDENI